MKYISQIHSTDKIGIGCTVISCMPIPDTLNDKVTHVTCTGKSFIVHWILSENLCSFACDKNKNKLFVHNYIGTQNGTYNISREAFTVCRKSMKAFSFVTIIYGIL